MASTRVVYIVTVPQTADVLLRGQLRFLREEGFDVTLIASPGLELDRVACREGVEIVPVPIAREIAPLRDLKSLLGLVRALRRIQPDIVNASTPKAGLLGMIAAAVTSVPVRIYVLRGLRLEGESGAKRRLLAALERVTMSVAHEVICVSSSLQERVLQLRLAPRRKLRVIGEGSSNGVDVKRFSSAHSARRELGIQSNEFVAGFVGRLVADKGLSELRRTAEHFAQRSNAVFLVVGGTEGEDGSALDEVARLRRLPNVISTGQVQDTAPYYRAMDVLLFPSYREGFPNAPLEASAASVPTIGFRVTGTVDAIQDGKTGKLVEKSATKLIEALDYYLAAPEMARMDGQLARSWVSEAFSPRRIWTGVRDRYHIWGRIAHGRQTGWSRVSKRAFDAGVAAIGLGAVSPLIAATAVGLALSFRSRDVVFRQLRPGRAGNLFEVMKFRTMTNERDADGRLLPDVARITRMGALVRTLSLDELPQLWNVVRGDMSFVGPRPLLVRYLDRYSDEQARRHDVMPGITGWAQVHGRNAVGWRRRFELDVFYVDHFSLLLDAKILVQTLATVLSRRGINEEGQATMTEFVGTPGVSAAEVP